MENLFSGVKDYFSNIYSYFLTFVLLFSLVFSFFGIVEKPEIKEAEFDFKVVYEIDGEIKTIEGTYVCEFGGIDRSFNGASRYWNGYIEGHDGSTCYVLKTIDHTRVMLELNLCAEFFMSDPDNMYSDGTLVFMPDPCIYTTTFDPDVENPEEFDYEVYKGDNIKIISFEYDPPIENTYSVFNIF